MKKRVLAILLAIGLTSSSLVASAKAVDGSLAIAAVRVLAHASQTAESATETDYPNHTLFGGSIHGTAQMDPWAIYPPTGRTYMDDFRSRGTEIWRINVSWPEYEPKPGQFNKEYLRLLKKEIDALVARGFRVIIDLNISDPPPKWIWESGDKAIFYRNQYGEDFIQTEREQRQTVSANIMNVIFNPFIRDKIERFETRFFEDLKDYKQKVWAVDATLTNDLFYPFPSDWHGKECTYWAFDDYAKRQAPINGRWPSLTNRPNPVPIWMPGSHDPDNRDNHEKARKFLNWYLESVNAAIHWRLNNIRRHYSGKIVLYSVLFTIHYDMEPFIQADLDCDQFSTDTGIYKPSQGLADGRYLASLKSRFPDDQVIVHNSGLEDLTEGAIEKTRRYYSKVGGEEATVGRAFFPYTNAEGKTFQTPRQLMSHVTDLVGRYRLYEFIWYGFQGLYEENLENPKTYNVGPNDYGNMIKQINGNPPTISNINAKRINNSQAEITWNTSDPSTSRVIFCEDPDMKSNPQFVFSTDHTRQHRMVISNLDPGKRYFFEVGSHNGKNYALSIAQEIRLARK